MRTKFMGLAALGVVLAGCGSGVQTPANVQGTWGADCASPFIKIGESQIHVYPDNADYDLKSVTLQGGNIVFGYDNGSGAVTETYAIEGGTLRLDHGVYGGSEATWHKQPMKKCAPG